MHIKEKLVLLQINMINWSSFTSVARTGVRPQAAGQLDSQTRSEFDLCCSLQPTDQGVCGSLRQQGKLFHPILVLCVLVGRKAHSLISGCNCCKLNRLL